MTQQSSNIRKKQKLLIKVLTCLWTQYVSNRTGASKTFFSFPSSEHYDSMTKELNALGTLLNNNDAIKSLDIEDGTSAFVNIFSAFANGVVAYNYANDVNTTSDGLTANTYQNALTGDIINSNIALDGNVFGLKNIQNLNTDETILQSMQLKPALSQNPDYKPNYGAVIPVLPRWVTEASVAERIGCAGVSNTGFVSMSIEVDLEHFPFNACDNLSVSCAFKKCHQ